ncbi:M24 family metallopeptidase [Phyllobacterium endophyticum]|uniref:M24 family metallopeptidase n=1 Tax=Phyllobacterium endophyticum TaxID=1149773 RepID=UPI0011CAFA6D|nr:Xaa-Pro peptidase family protein [Phyllobacterium endophyticum]TXR50513.1 M24 family metallopeptidase [Phyllobacterium endophyticum]
MSNFGDGIPFKNVEFALRIALVKAEMEKREIDALLISEPSNICYLTGYEAWSFYVFQMLVVHRDLEEPVWIGRFMDAVSVRRMTYLSDQSIRPYSDDYVQSVDRDPVDFLVSQLREFCPTLRAVGVETGSFYYSGHTHVRLLSLLPDVQLKDAELLINWIRIRKSSVEIEVMREAGVIADAMIKEAVDAAEPSMRECDLAAVLYRRMISGTSEIGGVYTSSAPYVLSGTRAGEPHAPWSDRIIGTDVPVNIETAGCRRRYHSPISRTIFLGKPSDAYLKLADAVTEGIEAALEVVKPGVTCAEVEFAWRETVARHGFHKEARLGYSIGIGFPPTWGERTASLRASDLTVIDEGMAFHMMPGLWLDNTGVTITQSFVVTARGREDLTKFPRKLIVK